MCGFGGRLPVEGRANLTGRISLSGGVSIRPSARVIRRIIGGAVVSHFLRLLMAALLTERDIEIA